MVDFFPLTNQNKCNAGVSFIVESIFNYENTSALEGLLDLIFRVLSPMPKRLGKLRGQYLGRPVFQRM